VIAAAANVSEAMVVSTTPAIRIAAKYLVARFILNNASPDTPSQSHQHSRGTCAPRGGNFIDVVVSESSVAAVMTRRIIQKEEMDVDHPGDVDDGNGRMSLKTID
jgi:hypothetical protein